MSEAWLEVRDSALDARDIERRIEERMARRVRRDPVECEDGERDAPVQVAESPGLGLPPQEAACDVIARWLQECDIVPANYVIDWRLPIIGPIHAAIRRLINAEIRRFLLPSLVKQSHLNRVVLRLLQELEQENVRLRQEVAQLRHGQAQDD